MPRTLQQLKRSRRRFAWTFVVSLAFSFLVVIPQMTLKSSDRLGSEATNPVEYPHAPEAVYRAPPPDGFLLISVVSLLTSVTSFGGLLATTILAWRKDKREKQSAALDLELKRLEIEKRRAELSNRSGDVVSHGSRELDI